MNHQEIKNILLWQFRNSFDIKDKADTYTSKSEKFEHVVNFIYTDHNGIASEAWARVEGELFKTDPSEYNHNPYPEKGGIGITESDDIELMDWWFTGCVCYIDTELAPFRITLDEISNNLKSQ